MLTEKFKFKNATDINKIRYLDTRLLNILSCICEWSNKNDCKIVITSTIRTKEENDALGSVSTTHMEGRAFDISTRKEFGWTYQKIQALIDHVNEKFSDVGAIGKDGIKRPVVYHDNGHGAHFHFQVRK